MKKRLLISLFLALLVIGSVVIISLTAKKEAQKTAAEANFQDYWPADGWRTSTPEEQGMDSGVLADMISSIKESGKDVNSITIIRNGYLVNEVYFYPYPKGIRHSFNSCTKSVLSALVGTSLMDGGIKSIDDKVVDYFPGISIANADKRKQELRIKNLLNMSAGLTWEIADNLSTSEMLQSGNWTQHTLDLPMREEPGRNFNYCNGAAQILSSIVQNSEGKSAAELASERLNIGIKDMFWGSSPENVSSGYSGIYAHPDDMARFGYLYLKNGSWNGRQLIPEDWVKESTRTQIKATWTPLFPGYGYMWWVNRFGGYAAMGFGGQYVYVVPESELVVVFTGGLYPVEDLFYPSELMEKYILPAVKSGAPLENNPNASKQLKQALDTVQKAPLSEPAASLPETARRISGKTFVMENSGTYVFQFKGVNECTIDSSSRAIYKVGLDNVFRVTEVTEGYGGLLNQNHAAFRGRWTDENTFRAEAQILEDGFELIYEAHFEGDRLQIKLTSNYLGSDVTLNGRIKE